MVAPPWVRLPPGGYGGVEGTVHALVVELMRCGHDVEVVTVGASSVPALAHWVHADDQYARIFDALYDNVAIPLSHLLLARQLIEVEGRFDVVHDHNYLLGPAVLGPSSRRPPLLHTVHGPFIPSGAEGPATNVAVYELLADDEQLAFNAISSAQLAAAPIALRPRMTGVVHNGIDVDPPGADGPRRKVVTLARFSPEKGHDVAARVCALGGHELVMAGSVGPLDTPQAVAEALAEPGGPWRQHRELRHFDEDVRPQLVPGRIDFVGAMRDRAKLRLLASARALLMPISWEEPFGLAAVEALACGTPVIGFRRGALPEIVDDGVTGFLVDDEAALATALDRVGELDPADCRRAACERFSAAAMARGYVQLYERMLDGAPTHRCQEVG